MPIPEDIRGLMMGSTPNPDAETPCVGVPSVGDTHFGETQVAIESVGELVAKKASDRGNAAPRKMDGLSLLPLSAMAWVSRVPRSMALGIGASLGIGAALLLGLLQSQDVEARSAPVINTRVEAFVQTEDGTGVVDVPVRVQNQVVLTDDSGRAPFPPLLLDGPLSVQAECPSGYTGGRLAREIPGAVAAASTSWSFRLVCRPEFSEVSMLVETQGCGEMKVWVDGALSGTTQEGNLTLSRRIQTAEVVEVRAEPTTGRCEFDNVRHVTLSVGETVSRVQFEGTSVRPTVHRRPKKPRVPSRPYRL